MSATPANSSSPLTAATDAVALTRLRAIPAAEAETLLNALLELKTPKQRQDYLIGEHRIALSLPALDLWLKECHTARDERHFARYLADVRRAAVRAEAFRELLGHVEQLHQVNVALLAARLFDALVARDQAAIENLAHSFAEVVKSLGFPSAPPHFLTWPLSANNSKPPNAANSFAPSSCASALPPVSVGMAWASARR